MSVRVLKWEDSRPEAVVCDRGRSVKVLYSVSLGLRSWTSWFRESRSSSSRFLLRGRAWELGFGGLFFGDGIGAIVFT